MSLIWLTPVRLNFKEPGKSPSFLLGVVLPFFSLLRKLDPSSPSFPSPGRTWSGSYWSWSQWTVCPRPRCWNIPGSGPLAQWKNQWASVGCYSQQLCLIGSPQANVVGTWTDTICVVLAKLDQTAKGAGPFDAVGKLCSLRWLNSAWKKRPCQHRRGREVLRAKPSLLVVTSAFLFGCQSTTWYLITWQFPPPSCFPSQFLKGDRSTQTLPEHILLQKAGNRNIRLKKGKIGSAWRFPKMGLPPNHHKSPIYIII